MAPAKDMVLRSDSQVVAPVSPEQTLKASKALLVHMKKATKDKAASATKKNLLEDDESAANETPIWMTVTTKRHITDNNRLKPHKITVPHKLATDPELSICLISASPQRAYKNLVASEEFPEEWRKRIDRIIDLTKLTAKYKRYEEQRKLFAEHDIFLGDSRIINRLPKALGKVFYKSTAKRPIPVDLQSRDEKKSKKVKGDVSVNTCTAAEMAAEIEKSVGAVQVHLSPSTNTAVRIGYASWTAEQIAANAEAVANELVKKLIPQQWKNVKSIYIKGPESAALPIWLTDELWLEEKDVVADDSEEAKALMAPEKANVGKKRKSLDGAAEPAEPKKAKKGKLSVKAETAGDDLDKEIAERKSKLKKQKAAAKKAVDV
ncbi:electron transfer flavoprotein alpha-subunit [Apiospora aurea]|uniref:Electron transfer flavoprotein alpha-subunit n=1 Tax=Apiospora aurea TaxID=335848 RepID=A0ABR1QK87_9PEZI